MGTESSFENDSKPNERADFDERDLVPRWVNLLLQAIIILAVVVSCIETMPELESWKVWFDWAELILVVIFTVEFITFWVLSKNRLRYPFRFMSIIDLLAILPFYLQFGVDLSSIRALRLMRLFRVLKLGRYSSAMQTLGLAVRRAGPELLAVLFIVSIIVVLSAMAMYYAENEAQPENFPSIPASLWWAIVTLTTVGYGDVYPVTMVGKIIASVIMLTSIGVIAVPAGIVSSALTEILSERRMQPILDRQAELERRDQALESQENNSPEE